VRTLRGVSSWRVGAAAWPRAVFVLAIVVALVAIALAVFVVYWELRNSP
jgi:hypothetical protein